MVNYLNFEKPLSVIEGKIRELNELNHQGDGTKSSIEEINKLEVKAQETLESLYKDLNTWEKTQVARHPERPHFLDYSNSLVEDFTQLSGDRVFGEDSAIIGGIGKLDNISVMLIGHEKGYDTETRIKHNFGMAHPEGYRKSIRLMNIAERFNLPVITFIDTPGAYPGIGAEERGQSEAIARNLFEMAGLRTPIIATVIGEGGSGGALAIGVADRVMMMQYSTYSVISPEGCASILWKSAEKASTAAEAMSITSKDLKGHELIDEIVPEPLGGAHRDPKVAARNLKASLLEAINSLSDVATDRLLDSRYQRLMSYGVVVE